MSDMDEPTERCRVYWGTHGCSLPRGHDGDCVCRCATPGFFEDDDEDDEVENVGGPPYYGPNTRFYGEDVVARGLRPLTPGQASA